MQAGAAATPSFQLVSYTYVADILEKRGPHREGHLAAARQKVTWSARATLSRLTKARTIAGQRLSSSLTPASCCRARKASSYWRVRWELQSLRAACLFSEIPARRCACAWHKRTATVSAVKTLDLCLTLKVVGPHLALLSRQKKEQGARAADQATDAWPAAAGHKSLH